MFYSGDLQSGIGLAIQSGRCVACFVRDASDESKLWEEEWLVGDDDLRESLSRCAVTLKLEAGGQEAGFLGAFCPLKEVPALVVIHNGQLKEHLAAPVDHKQFRERLRRAIGVNDSQTGAPQAATTQIPPTSSTPSVKDNPTTSQNPPTRTPEQVLAEHQARVEVERIAREKRQKEEAEKRKREDILRQQQQQQRQAPAPPSQRGEPSTKPKEKGKQREVPPGLSDKARADAEAKKVQRIAAEEARKAKLHRQSDLERVQARIEADKIERKSHQRRLEQERAAGAAAAAGQDQTPASSFPRPQVPRSRSAAGQNVQLQVRLFDGSTIRSPFPSSSTLAATVRPWIDTKLENPPPYTLRHILAPLPSREIPISEENLPLAELEMFPSATLVLVPAKSWNNAYAAGYDTGVVGAVQSGMTGTFGFLGGVLGSVGGALRTFAGLGGEVASEQTREQRSGQRLERGAGSTASAEQASGSGIKIRTLADQRREGAKDDTELYNGNQLNFEPRDDGDDRR